MAERARLVECANTRLRCNSAHGLRQHLAAGLHWLCRHLDQRILLAIEIDSSPALARPVQHQVVRAGVEHMSRLAHAECLIEAQDLLLQRVLPDLFADPKARA